MSERAIGIFDSGVGGLTVFKEIERLLPGEELVYIGDTARVPYGCKSPATVARYALEAANFLLDQGGENVGGGLQYRIFNCSTGFGRALSHSGGRRDWAWSRKGRGRHP